MTGQHLRRTTCSHLHSNLVDEFIMQCDHCWGEPDCMSPTHDGAVDTNACCICGDPRVKKRTTEQPTGDES